jgi:SAM-dependent methyltransferase
MAPELSDHRQKEHYEAIHDAYEAHYYDQPSMAYRHRFIYRPLLDGAQLNGASVADIACGSGHNSLALRKYFPSVRTTGYDISESACRDYRIRTGNPAHQIDLTRPATPVEVHDAAIVVGGLHHCVTNLDMTFRNIAQMIRPGGQLLMMEPNEDFFLSSVRRIWYRKDPWFEADSEAALKHDEIVARASPYFTPRRVVYFGGPAFFLIYNSLIMRIPLRVKPWLSPVLFPVEGLYNRLPGRAAFAVFVAEWQRTHENA